MSSQVFIPERFRRTIVLHVLKNFFVSNNVFKDTSFRVPLILGINGPSGDGKTFQCEKVLEEQGVKPFLISGGQLESGVAGEPAKLIRETYIAAGGSVRKGESCTSVMLINDIDTGLGNWGDKVQTTINTQTVYGELMHLVDYPTTVEGRKTERIPIIVTGNDFTKLYSPLVRAGRMTAFEWQPSMHEKVEIVKNIFPEILPDDIVMLVSEFKDQPIAFYSHLKSTLMDDLLWNEAKKVGLATVTASILKGYKPKVTQEIKYDLAIQAGRNLVNSGQLVNHLRDNNG